MLDAIRRTHAYTLGDSIAVSGLMFDPVNE